MALAAHERIRYWRELREISQGELGTKAGMPQSKISRIETGAISVTAEDLAVLVVKGLGLTMVEFYAGGEVDEAGARSA